MSSPSPQSFVTPIRLDQFLKLSGIADTGGQAKTLIQFGEVKVNGVLETRRGLQLKAGDTVQVAGTALTVVDSREVKSPTEPA